MDFGHLRDLDGRGVFWVTRAKEKMGYEVVKKMPRSKDPKILADEIIVLRDLNKPAPELMRRVVAVVEVDGQEQALTFLTNHLEWSPRSVADLYRCRWQFSPSGPPRTSLSARLSINLWDSIRAKTNSGKHPSNPKIEISFSAGHDESLEKSSGQARPFYVVGRL